MVLVAAAASAAPSDEVATATATMPIPEKADQRRGSSVSVHICESRVSNLQERNKETTPKKDTRLDVGRNRQVGCECTY